MDGPNVIDSKDQMKFKDLLIVEPQLRGVITLMPYKLGVNERR
ncbi:MAG: hypothetical protein ACXAEX_16120 [Promethearchaeota archaeon]